MTVAREELLVLALVLLSVGLLAYGVADLVWPRRAQKRREPRRRPARRAAPVPIPDATPPMAVPAGVPPAPMSVDEILEHVGYLIDFPLRALVLLRRADARLAEIATETPRVAEWRRRLSAARATVGCRLVEAGLAEQALGPLTQVVSGDGLAGDDLQRARESLVTALTTITEQRVHAIRRLAQDGNQAAAVTHAERLATLLRNAVEAGVTEAELAGSLGTAQRLFVQLGVRRVVLAR